MKDLINKIKILREKVIIYFKTFTFRKAVILLAVAFGALLILNLILLPKPSETVVLTVNDNQTITGSDGQVISYYEYIDNTQSKGTGNYITIYVLDVNNITGPQIKSLIAKVLAKKGLNEKDVTVNIEQMTDLPESGFDFTNDQAYDPTNPATYIGKTKEQLGVTDENEPNAPSTMSDFVALNPANTSYDILPISGNHYTVILKNGYTEAQFRSDVLQNITDANNVQLEFVDIFKFKEQAN